MSFHNLEAYSRTSVDVKVQASSCPYFVDVYVVAHGHIDDSVTEFFLFDVGPLQVALDGVENLQCCEFWWNFLLEFHWFSIHSQSSLKE